MRYEIRTSVLDGLYLVVANDGLCATILGRYLAYSDAYAHAARLKLFA